MEKVAGWKPAPRKGAVEGERRMGGMTPRICAGHSMVRLRSPHVRDAQCKQAQRPCMQKAENASETLALQE